MRFFPTLVLTIALFALASGAPGTAAWAQTQTGPDGTPQVEASAETQRYTEGALPELLTHYWIVMSGVDAFPQYPNPDQVKGTDLRKRILDLRLVMDLNAYAYQPGTFEAYRDAIDVAYEQVGEYKDLFDIQRIDGAPIDPAFQAERLAKMNVAMAPFRVQSFRDDLKNWFYGRSEQPLSLEFKNQPRLWQIAKLGPTDSLDSAGNAAMLGQAALRNLRNDGLLVGDIFDPAQEIRFHDVRKAMRSVLVLADMFPSINAQTNGVRQPLADLVDAYGKTNDRVVAFHAAQLRSSGVDVRAADLGDSFTKTQALARQFVDSGALEAFASKLDAAQAAHRR